MIISAFGDSFTFGQELTDRKNAWPYLLSGLLNAEVTNYGNPAASNDKMIRLLLDDEPADISILAWSHYARREFADGQGIFDVSSGSHWGTSPGVEHRDNLVKHIAMHGDDNYDYSCYLRKIILTQSYLKANGKRYIMLDAFGNTTVQRLQHTKLTNQIDTTYYLGWPNESMMEWTYGTQQGPGGHFLDDGHKIVANKIYEYITQLGWI